MCSGTAKNIGKIIKSDSHVNYKCRIYGKLESNEEISERNYRFGQFVKMTTFDDIVIIGVIYNSQLYNPEYGHFGPRLSIPASDNQVFMPDFIEETAVLLDIMLLGWMNQKEVFQELPPWVIPLNTEVTTITGEDFLNFHISTNEELMLSYYNQILVNTGNIAYQLIINIIHQLQERTDWSHKEKLNLLKQHILWQQTTLATKV